VVRPKLRIEGVLGTLPLRARIKATISTQWRMAEFLRFAVRVRRDQ
jgi:hypothetical protein